MRFSDTLRHRKAWLGVAMIWILIYHIPIEYPGSVLNLLRAIGYGGVDICLFASGVGCFYSLTSDPDTGRFFKRRMQKLAPCYFVFIFFWLIYKALRSEVSLPMAIGNLLGVQSFTGLGGDFNWYISAIFLFYLLAPYFKAFINRAKPWVKYLFLLLLVAFSIPFWDVDALIITISRLPVFYAGMLLGDICQKNVKITPKHIVFLGVSFIVGLAALLLSRRFLDDYLWSKGLHWYPFILMTPAICMAVSWLMQLLEKNKVTKLLVSFISLLGEYSFEIYLVQVPILEVLKGCIRHFSLQHLAIFIWLGSLILLAAGCFILRRLAKLLGGAFQKMKTS